MTATNRSSVDRLFCSYGVVLTDSAACLTLSLSLSLLFLSLSLSRTAVRERQRGESEREREEAKKKRALEGGVGTGWMVQAFWRVGCMKMKTRRGLLSGCVSDGRLEE